MVPWLGKIGLNLYGTYDGNRKDWNGFQISTNWFKPFYFFENGSFISYQGYIDYQFGMNDDLGALQLAAVVLCSTVSTGTQTASRLVTV